MNTRSTPLLYKPGEYLKVGRPITKGQFENKQNMAFAVPLDLAKYGKDPIVELCSGVLFVNYTGDSCVLAASRPSFQATSGELYNEQRILEATVPKGESIFVPFPPTGYVLSVSEFSLDAQSGRRIVLSDAGLPFTDIEGKHITLLTGEETGEVRFIVGNKNSDKHTSIKNATLNQLAAQVVRQANTTATPEQIEILRQSRQPDLGGQEIAEAVIKPGGNFHFLPSPTSYIFRVLQTRREQQGMYCGITGTTQVPPLSSYVELDNILASSGEVVVALSNEDRNGGVVLESYNLDGVKLVDSSIVENERYR